MIAVLRTEEELSVTLEVIVKESGSEKYITKTNKKKEILIENKQVLGVF